MRFPFPLTSRARLKKFTLRSISTVFPRYFRWMSAGFPCSSYNGTAKSLSWKSRLRGENFPVHGNHDLKFGPRHCPICHLTCDFALVRVREFLQKRFQGKNSISLYVKKLKKHLNLKSNVKSCHFGPLPPLPWPLGHVRLNSFVVTVHAALLFISTC